MTRRVQVAIVQHQAKLYGVRVRTRPAWWPFWSDWKVLQEASSCSVAAWRFSRARYYADQALANGVCTFGSYYSHAYAMLTSEFGDEASE